jgi:hypothetical protein
MQDKLDDFIIKNSFFLLHKITIKLIEVTDEPLQLKDTNIKLTQSVIDTLLLAS